MKEGKKLYRSMNQEMIAGVCGGIAEYFNIDVTFVRIAFALLGFAYFSSLAVYLAVYIVLAIIIPQEPIL